MLIRLGIQGLVVCPFLSAFLVGAPLTFHQEIEPILQLRCQSCHRPGEAGPMPLLTYQQTRPWAKAIRSAVLSGKMPPWQADPRYGHFSNDLSLSAAEKSALVAWVDGGAVEGNLADAPRQMTFVDGWRIPQPDVIFEMPAAFNVPVAGTLDYQYIS